MHLPLVICFIQHHIIVIRIISMNHIIFYEFVFLYLITHAMLNSKSNFQLLTQHNLKQNLLFDENISCVTFPQSEFFPKYFDRKKCFLIQMSRKFLFNGRGRNFLYALKKFLFVLPICVLIFFLIREIKMKERKDIPPHIIASKAFHPFR